jgi:hypothetical protein
VELEEKSIEERIAYVHDYVSDAGSKTVAEWHEIARLARLGAGFEKQMAPFDEALNVCANALACGKMSVVVMAVEAMLNPGAPEAKP